MLEWVVSEWVVVKAAGWDRSSRSSKKNHRPIRNPPEPNCNHTELVVKAAGWGGKDPKGGNLPKQVCDCWRIHAMNLLEKAFQAVATELNQLGQPPKTFDSNKNRNPKLPLLCRRPRSHH